MGNKKNNRYAIVKHIALTKPTLAGNCWYHCNSIPTTNGNNSLIKGAFFQKGISNGFDIS
jgi:hypothetical protein